MGTFKVLIVEDEKLIREELSLFPWEESGMQLIADAADGEEALRIFNDVEPEVVITDIMMPVMDGLELTRCIKESKPNTEIVMLTCYSDYTYLRKAMQYGVKDYLLKGVYTTEDLKTTLERITEHLHKKKTEVTTNDEHHRELLASPIANSHMLNWLTSNQTDNPQHAEVSYPCIPLSLLFRTNGRSEEGNPSIVFSSLIARVLKPLRPSCIVQVTDKEFFITLPASSILSSIDLTALESDGQYSCFMAVGEFAHDHNELKERYISNCSFIKHHFYHKRSTILLTNELPPIKQLGFEHILDLNARMKSLMYNPEPFIEFLMNDFTDMMSNMAVDPMDVKLLLVQWITDLERILKIDQPIVDKELLIHAADIQDMITYVSNAFQEVLTPAMSTRFEVNKTIQLICERLHEPITLYDISNQVGLSPKYLGLQFKKYTGESFRDYLKRMRLQKATELLTESNLKIYEIALQVGIPNYRYFCEIFNLAYGKTPKEYRGMANE